MKVTEYIPILRENVQRIIDCPVVVAVEKFTEEDGWDKDMMLVYVRGCKLPISERFCLVKTEDGRWFTMFRNEFDRFVQKLSSGEVEQKYPSCSLPSYRPSKTNEEETDGCSQGSPTQTTPSKKDEDSHTPTAGHKNGTHEYRHFCQKLRRKAEDFWRQRDQR